MGLIIDDDNICPECGAYYQTILPHCANGHSKKYKCLVCDNNVDDKGTFCSKECHDKYYDSL